MLILFSVYPPVWALLNPIPNRIHCLLSFECRTSIFGNENWIELPSAVGMAVLNTHPDYMCFGGKSAVDEFPISYYEEFLSYVRQKYEGAFRAKSHGFTLPIRRPLRVTRGRRSAC